MPERERCRDQAVPGGLFPVSGALAARWRRPDVRTTPTGEARTGSGGAEGARRCAANRALAPAGPCQPLSTMAGLAWPRHGWKAWARGSCAAISDIAGRPSAGRSRASTGHPGARRLRLRATGPTERAAVRCCWLRSRCTNNGFGVQRPSQNDPKRTPAQAHQASRKLPLNVVVDGQPAERTGATRRPAAGRPCRMTW